MKLLQSKHIWVVLILSTLPLRIFSQTGTPSFEYEVIYMDIKAPSFAGDTIPDKYIVLDEPGYENLEKLLIIKGDKEYSYTKDQLTRNHLHSVGGKNRIYIKLGKATETSGIIVTGTTTKKDFLFYTKAPDEIEKLLLKQEREENIPFEKNYDIKPNH